MHSIDTKFTTSETNIMINLTSHYLKKHHDLVVHITPKIKNNNVLNVLSFCGTEYDKFSKKYNWDTLERMFRHFMIYKYIIINNFNGLCIGNNSADSIEFVIHFLKKFMKFQSVIPIFYPNIATDFKKHTSFRDDRYFHWASWFEHSGRYGFDDQCTNYEIILKMFIQVLKHFDDWYWNYYDGDNVVETSLVEDIVDIYKSIEKFYFSEKNRTPEEVDETFKEAMP